ncbi:unnamed protein product [Dicrocoelium dendriticum]|nr:unnamed protein product [Dicrocoelium dendriticum]
MLSWLFLLPFAVCLASFWTTTGHDATLLPTREDALKIVTNLPDSSDDYRTDVGSLPPTYNPGTPYALRRSKGFNLLYTLEPETQDIVCPAPGGPLIYPRLALAWPFLSVCGPFKHHPNGSSSTTSCVALWQWPPPGTLDRRTPKLISPCVTMSPVAGGHCVWSAFRGGPATTDSTVSGQLHLLTADSTGSLEVWDLVKGSKILHFNAVRHCGGVLRCCAVPTSSTSASMDNQQSVVLTGGSSGVIGCWDCRVGTDPTRPQNTFTTSRSLLLVSIFPLTPARSCSIIP